MIANDRLREIAASLERDADGSKTQLKRIKPPHLVGLTANRSGFLRLAAACLRVAVEPILDDDCRSRPVDLPHEHTQVVDEDTDSIVGFLQRMETWPEPREFVETRQKRARQNDRGALLTCSIVGFVVLFVLVAGILAIAGLFQ